MPEKLPRWLYLSPLRPRHLDDWASEGFPVRADNIGERREFPLAGKTNGAASTASRLHLDLLPGFANPYDWGGVSGAPVVVHGQVVGVIVQTPTKAEHRLKATFAASLFRCPEFAEKLGYNDDRACKDAAEQALRLHLDAAAAKPLRGPLGARLGSAPNSAEALAQALLNADPDDVLDALHAAVKALPAAQRPTARASVADIIGEMLPCAYDPVSVTALMASAAQPDAYVLEIPAGLRTSAEVIMAGVRGRPTHFKDLPNRDSLPEPRDLLDPPPESGFDSDGSRFIGDVEADLAARLGLDEEEQYVSSDQDRATMREIVNDELDKRAIHRREFYYMLLDADAATLPVGARSALGFLKGKYGKLDFGVLALQRDLKARKRERERLWLLRELLPCAEDTSR